MRTVRSRPRRVWFALPLVALAPACTGGSEGGSSPPSSAVAPTTSTTVRARPAGPLRLGIVLPTTGTNAAFGKPLDAGAQLAVQQINEAGGVNGEGIVAVPIDEGKDLADLRQLIVEGALDAIVGPATSPAALSVAETVNEEQVATCTPTAGTVAVTKFGNRYLFRTFPSDALQGAALAEAVNSSGLPGGRGVVILYQRDEYGQVIADRVSQELSTSVVRASDALAYDTEATDAELDAIAGSTVAALPDVVVVIGLPDGGGRMLARLRLQPGYSRISRVYVSSAMRVPDLFERVAPAKADALLNVEGVSPLANTFLRTFLDPLQERFPDAGVAFASYAYDCVNLIALAAQAAGSNDARVFTGLVGDVSRPNPGLSCDSFVECMAILSTKLNIDYDGVSGPVNLDESGDVTSARYELFRFDETGSDVRQLDFPAPR